MTQQNQKIPVGYKLTEVGVIPTDWEVKKLGEICDIKKGQLITESTRIDGDIPVIAGGKTPAYYHNKPNRFGKTITISGSGASAGYVAFHDYPIFASDCSTIEESNKYSVEFIHCTLQLLQEKIYKMQTGGAQPHIHPSDLNPIEIGIPKSKDEQTLIATVLSDIDELITQMDELIAKKKAIKQGAMQSLLTPKDDWEVKKLGDLVDILDNLRRPLNDNQRSKMKGNIPYCGANNIMDYVNDFVVDDEILLMAEDGGYFDEYKTRPIVYKMNGKCRVNNHAHILKAKKEIDQNFLFYSLVHKNILDFINGGTRAKLNRGELVNILIPVSNSKSEQTRIATILSDIDNDIQELEQKKSKHEQIKQGAMQQLLTGKIRLV